MTPTDRDYKRQIRELSAICSGLSQGITPDTELAIPSEAEQNIQDFSKRIDKTQAKSLVDRYETLNADMSDENDSKDGLPAAAHFCIGASYYVLGDWPKASDQLSIYVNRQPQDPLALFNFAITLVKSYDELGHVALLEQALKNFGQAVNLKARFPEALAYWGSALWKMYDETTDIQWLERADEKLRQAASLDPSSYRIHYLWGGCSATMYSATGQDEWLRLAYRECCRSVELAAEGANPYFNFACVLAMMGEKERMLQALRRSIGFDRVYRKLACEAEEFEVYRNDEDFRDLVGNCAADES